MHYKKEIMNTYKSQIEECGARMNLGLEQGDFLAWTAYGCLRKELQEAMDSYQSYLNQKKEEQACWGDE